MANIALTNEQTTGNPFTPNGPFRVSVYGTITGNLFVQHAENDADLTDDSNWNNAHDETFEDGIRTRTFDYYDGLTFRVNAATMGPTARWSHRKDNVTTNLR